MTSPPVPVDERELQYKFHEHLESYDVYDSAYVPYVSPKRNCSGLRAVTRGDVTRKTPEPPGASPRGNPFARFPICAMARGWSVPQSVVVQLPPQDRLGW